MTPPPPPPPKPAPPPPPPPPAAPQFPYRWIGRFNDDAVDGAVGAVSAATSASAANAKPAVIAPIKRAILETPNATLVVKVGDVIEGTWRVDQIQDRSMTVMYLSLQQSQQVYLK